jgi:hypothetical protein
MIGKTGAPVFKTDFIDRMVALIDWWLTPTLAIFQLYRGARKIETYNKDLLWTVPSDYLYKITYWLRWHSHSRYSGAQQILC